VSKALRAAVGRRYAWALKELRDLIIELGAHDKIESASRTFTGDGVPYLGALQHSEFAPYFGGGSLKAAIDQRAREILEQDGDSE
jgi:hypothetical protein